MKNKNIFLKKINYNDILNIKTDFIIIDVRSLAEYRESHIKESINISYDIIEKEIEKYVKDKNKKIIVYCRSWNRSFIAWIKLIGMWYSDVADFWAFYNWMWEIE